MNKTTYIKICKTLKTLSFKERVELNRVPNNPSEEVQKSFIDFLAFRYWEVLLNPHLITKTKRYVHFFKNGKMKFYDLVNDKIIVCTDGKDFKTYSLL